MISNMVYGYVNQYITGRAGTPDPNPERFSKLASLINKHLILHVSKLTIWGLVIRERGSALKGGRRSTMLLFVFFLNIRRKVMLVKCPSVQWQPDGLTIQTKSGS